MAVAVCIIFVRLLHVRVKNNQIEPLAKITYSIAYNEMQHAEKVILKLMLGHDYPNEVELKQT